MKRIGISLAGFEVLIEAVGGRDVLIDKTTAWLKQNFVLPVTAEDSIPYSDLLRCRVNSEELVGSATQFISHAYSMPFLYSVDAIVSWVARNPRPDGALHFFYFDLLVVNQHGQTMGVSSDILWDEFAGGVRSVGHTLLVLSYDNPVPLTRAWCLAEIVTGVGDTGGVLEVVMPPEECDKFRSALVDDFESIAFKTCNVLLESATAYHGGECLVNGVCRHVLSKELESCPNDLKFIKAAVERELGFNEANARIISAMQRWMHIEGAAQLATMDTDTKAVSCLTTSFARLLIDMNRIHEAHNLLKTCLHDREAALGPNHLLTLDAVQRYSYVLHRLGKEERALRYCERAYRGRESVLGPHHADTLCSKFYLICQKHATDDFMGIDVGQLEILDQELKAALGAEHPVYLAYTVKYAKGLLELFLTEEDDPEHMFMGFDYGFAALKILRARLGDSHPKVIAVMKALAELHTHADEYNMAAKLYRFILPRQKRLLGPTHKDTLEILKEYAYVLSCSGKTTEEEVEINLEVLYLETCNGLSRYRSVSWSYCGGMLKELNRFREAAPLFAIDAWWPCDRLRNDNDRLVSLKKAR